MMEAFFHFRCWSMEGLKEQPFTLLSNGGIGVLVKPSETDGDYLVGSGHVVPPTGPYQKKKVRRIVRGKWGCIRLSTARRRCTLRVEGSKTREAARTLARTTARSVLRAYTGVGKVWLRTHVLFSRPIPKSKRKESE